MKLTIKNWNKIIGARVLSQSLSKSDWIVSDVSVSEDYYCFFCREENGNGYMTSVRLKRDGFQEGGQWKYRFWHPPGHGISQVTTDFFANIDNAISIIGNELKKL